MGSNLVYIGTVTTVVPIKARKSQSEEPILKGKELIPSH